MAVYDLGRVTEPVPVMFNCYKKGVGGFYRRVASISNVKDGGFCKITYDASMEVGSAVDLSSTGEIIFSTSGVWNSCTVNMKSQEFAIVKKKDEKNSGAYYIELYISTGADGKIYHLTKGVCYNRTYDESTKQYSIEYIENKMVFDTDEHIVPVAELSVLGDVYTSQSTIKVAIDWNAAAKVGKGENITFWANPSIEDGVVYQWYRHGVALTNANQRFFTIINAQSYDEGTYTVSIVKTMENDTQILSAASVELTVDGTATDLALGKSYEYTVSQPSASYPDTGKRELTDGVVPTTLNFFDAKYVGFSGSDGMTVITLDLDVSKTISRVTVMLMNSGNSGISFPKSIAVQTSDNGKDWKDFGKAWACPDSTISKQELAGVIAVTFNGTANARYVRLTSIRVTHEFWSEIQVY